MESAGINTAIAQANLAKEPHTLTFQDIKPHLESLRSMGVFLDADLVRHMLSKVEAIGPAVSQKMHRAMQSRPFVHHHKAMHYTMLASQVLSKRGTSQHSSATSKTNQRITPAIFTPQSKAGLTNASFHPRSNLHAAMQSGTVYESVWVYADQWPGEDDIELMDEATSGHEVWTATTDNITTYMPDDFVTPSGVHIQWCTVYDTLLSLASGGLGAVMGYLSTFGPQSLIIAGVALDPAAIAALLALLSLYYAACTVLC